MGEQRWVIKVFGHAIPQEPVGEQGGLFNYSAGDARKRGSEEARKRGSEEARKGGREEVRK